MSGACLVMRLITYCARKCQSNNIRKCEHLMYSCFFICVSLLLFFSVLTHSASAVAKDRLNARPRLYSFTLNSPSFSQCVHARRDCIRSLSIFGSGCTFRRYKMSVFNRQRIYFQISLCYRVLKILGDYVVLDTIN